MGAFRRRWPGISYGRGEDWHYVGATGEPAFENSWDNVSGETKMAFRKREADVIDVYGVISGGSSGTVAFTLPEGYRPSDLIGINGIGLSTGASPPFSVTPFVFLSNGMVLVVYDTPAPALFGVNTQIFLQTPAVAP